MQNNLLNVLIVDDTITYRSILTRVVESIPNTHIVGTASNGKIALTKLNAHTVDLVLLDIEMPEMDGLETLQVIHKQFPEIGVVMVSGLNRSSADITIRALEMGAIDFISKPDGDSLTVSKEELHCKISQVLQHFKLKRNGIKALPQVKRQLLPDTSINETRLVPILNSFKSFDVLAIGVSTGGPNALSELIPALPDNLNVPILLVQHMPPIFTESLANSLNRKSKLTVKEAVHEEPVECNTVYIAPGGKHMAVAKRADKVIINIHDGEPENSCRPAVDVLFRSISEVYGKNVLSLIMTGMGSDGALGVKALKQQGAYSIVQSEKSCVIYGMPKAVEEMKLADESVDLSDLAARITQLILQKGRH